MFSQTTKIPAKVYRSTDKDAPKLDAVAGSLKTLLKACLVTGYGADDSRKEPAGWAMPFENDVNAVFRSQSPESTKFCLQINNENDNYAVLGAYQRMSNLNTGTGYFGYADIGQNHFAYAGTGSGGSTGKWLLVACERAFWLTILDTNNTSLVLFFGDARPLAPADNTACVFVHSNYSTATNWDTGSLKNPMLAQAWQGSGALMADLGGNYYSNSNLAPYPDPIHGGFIAHEVFVMEKQTYRAVLPNLLSSMNNLRTAMPTWSILKLDGDDADYLLLDISDSGGNNHLLNLSYFEYN